MSGARDGWAVGVLLLLACGDDAKPARDVSDALDSRGEETGVAEISEEVFDSSVSDGESSDAVDETDETDAGPDDTVVTDLGEVGDTSDDGVEGSTEELDPDLEPCDFPEYWPFSIRSQRVPVRVHYRVPGDAASARETLRILEHAWEFEVDGLGFLAPLLDDGSCGPDEAIDVFTWRGAEDTYVNIWEENDATPWDDGYPYMVVDAWGEFGGDELPVTLAHEFNHMCQAAYDWSDAAFIYEATATFIEDIVYDDHDSWRYLLFDFQGNPDWSLDRNDDYETWYMYGAMLWLRFLRDRYFEGDDGFVAELWQGLRSPAEENEPDFVDSLDQMLASFGASYADSIVEFVRWRWYVEARDDGMHLEEAGELPSDALPMVAATLQAAGGSAIVRPMMLGTSYVDVVSDAGGAHVVRVSLETAVAAGDVQWVVQALPGIGGSDGDLLTLPATVPLAEVDGRFMRTLVVTALPGMERDIDPDERTDERFRATLKVSAP